MVCACKCRLCPVSAGLGIGLIWALGLLGIGWLGAGFHYGLSFIHTFSSIYLGYAPTFWGGVIGFVWALVDGFVSGWLVASIYNVSLGKPDGCCGKGKES